MTAYRSLFYSISLVTLASWDTSCVSSKDPKVQVTTDGLHRTELKKEGVLAGIVDEEWLKLRFPDTSSAHSDVLGDFYLESPEELLRLVAPDPRLPETHTPELRVLSQTIDSSSKHSWMVGPDLETLTGRGKIEWLPIETAIKPTTSADNKYSELEISHKGKPFFKLFAYISPDGTQIFYGVRVMRELAKSWESEVPPKFCLPDAVTACDPRVESASRKVSPLWFFIHQANEGELAILEKLRTVCAISENLKECFDSHGRYGKVSLSNLFTDETVENKTVTLSSSTSGFRIIYNLSKAIPLALPVGEEFKITTKESSGESETFGESYPIEAKEGETMELKNKK